MYWAAPKATITVANARLFRSIVILRHREAGFGGSVQAGLRRSIVERRATDGDSR
jgi:hypothetical protein